jgi:protein nanos 1
MPVQFLIVMLPFSDDVMTEFRLNGQDSEYCPEFLPTNKCFAESNSMFDLAAGCASTAAATRSRKRLKKPIQECVFCKNNGEEETYYKRHILKDQEGRIVCPVLRAYTCPICNAKGDKAHTIKYCPLNNNPDSVAPITTLKALRTSTGHRRNKSISLSGPEIHIFRD